MLVTTKAKYVRISPKKVRTVLPIIRRKNALRAEAELKLVNRKAAQILSKVLKTAIADAEHNFNLKKDTLVVKEVRAEQGPVFKRFQPRARGAAYQILKRTSHIKLVLEGEESGKAVKKQTGPVDVSWDEIEKSAAEAKKAKAAEKPEEKLASSSSEKAEETAKPAAQESISTFNEQSSRGSNAVKRFFRRKSG